MYVQANEGWKCPSSTCQSALLTTVLPSSPLLPAVTDQYCSLKLGSQKCVRQFGISREPWSSTFSFLVHSLQEQQVRREGGRKGREGGKGKGEGGRVRWRERGALGKEGGRVHMVTCLVSIPLQLSVKVKGRRMLKAVTMATRRIELQGLGFKDSRRDKPIFRSEKNMSNSPPRLL